MNSYAQPVRSGWHAATVLMVVAAPIALLLSIASIVGILLIFWFAMPMLFVMVMGIVAGAISDRTWRSIVSGLAFLSALMPSFIMIVVGLLTSWFTGFGIFLLAGGFFGFVAAGAALAEMVQTINRAGGSRGVTRFEQAYQPMGQPQVIINNNSSAQVGNNYRSTAIGLPAAAGGARIAVFDLGQTGVPITAQMGQVFVIGRDSLADIRLGDPKASRRHLEVTLEPGGWALRDLGATNPARLLSGGAPNQVIRGATLRLPAGQVAVGDAVITLYPPGRRG